MKRNNSGVVNYGTRICENFLNWFRCVNIFFLFPLLSQVYEMFPFWYGHYPYQVAEDDECPVSGPGDLPQPLFVPVLEERWNMHSTMWRPWFSKGIEIFVFFQVDFLPFFFSFLIETMIVRGGGRKVYISKGRERGTWAQTGTKILKETPDREGSLSWS